MISVSELARFHPAGSRAAWLVGEYRICIDLQGVRALDNGLYRPNLRFSYSYWEGVQHLLVCLSAHTSFHGRFQNEMVAVTKVRREKSWEDGSSPRSSDVEVLFLVRLLLVMLSLISWADDAFIGDSQR